MVPVSLKLRNFLSYGDAAEPLNFEEFRVACLSGGNGQGKSALLDAVTWALWGEARKAADARKPDEDLLRIGAREMEVDLAFDLEGERYRVVRTYQRSASGKTSKPGLEFQVEDGAGGWRPLTAPSVRETQRAINRALSVDYETFINSAFLLQGRSDEFTKKKPTERKEILGKILGLSRYERLANAAKARYRDALEQFKTAEAEVGRLKDAVADEARLKEEHAEAEAVIAALAKELEELQARERTLRDRLAALDAVAKRAAEQRERLGALTEQRQKVEAERAELAARIEEAEGLIAQADRITQDYERHRTLSAERTALDEKRDLELGLKDQALRLREQVQRREQEQRDRLAQLEAGLAADRERCKEAQRRLLERPAAEAGLQKARAAAAEAERLRERLSVRRGHEELLAKIEQELASERGAINAHIARLTKEVGAAEAALERLPAARRQITALAERAERVRSLEEQRADVREQGSGLTAAVDATDREVGRLRAEVEKVNQKSARLAALETEECPTCGTALTPEHRRAVEATYAADRAALEEQIAELERGKAEREAEREALRRRYREVDAEIGKLNGVAERLVRARAEVEAAEGRQAAAEEQRAEIARLTQQLADEAFRPELVAERAELRRRLSAEPFDEAHFERVQEAAAQRPRYEARLKELAEVEGHLQGLTNKIAREEIEAARLREEAVGGAGGAAARDLRQRIENLEKQRAAVGYDGERHDAVRRALDALRDAPERHTLLQGARANAADWKERRAARADDLRRLDAEADALRTAVAAAEAELEERADRQAEADALAKDRGETEARLSRSQARRGGLRARLDACERNRARLAEVRAELREHKKQKTLYHHLRTAFGRNGIPALIIEETLPEIEDRANALLARLSRGRTRVQLETLKDKKAGGTKETLDITITDTAGVPRPYETYSGGEAFRVNFALRIALAQLLAERAGVRIRTLVVDEGFGTQDKRGIEALVSAIQTVSDDFEKILVVTHLDELKEAFPVRIEVAKDPVAGSRYDVIGV